MTTTESREVPLPAGATYADRWHGGEAEMPYRFNGSEVREITDRVSVLTNAVQYGDGSIDDGRIEAPGVFISDWRIPNDKVREMISVLQESLALVESWATGSS